MAVFFLLFAAVALGLLLANRRKGNKALAEVTRLTAENPALVVFKDIRSLCARQESLRIEMLRNILERSRNLQQNR